MSESKTYVFQPDSGGCNSAMSMLAPLMANRGMDAATLSALMNNNGFGGNMWVIFLFFLMGWGGNGWGNNRGNLGTDFLSAQMNNETGRELLQQAINGNSGAISQLATNLNVETTAIQGALSHLGTSVQNVASQVGMTGQQVINAIQQGNCQIVNQMAQTCCDIKNSITTQGYEARISNIEQTNILGSKIDAQTTLINEHFAALELRALQDKLEAARAENTSLKSTISNYNQNATINQIVAQATAPVAATINSIHEEVEDIKRAVPTTVSVPLNVAYPGIMPIVGYNYNGSLWS